MTKIETLRRLYHGRLVPVDDTVELRTELQRLWDSTEAHRSYDERKWAYEALLVEAGFVRERASTTMAEPCDICGKLDASQCSKCNKCNLESRI